MTIINPHICCIWKGIYCHLSSYKYANTEKENVIETKNKNVQSFLHVHLLLGMHTYTQLKRAPKLI